MSVHVDRRGLMRGMLAIAAADTLLNNPLARVAEAFASPVEVDKPFDAKNNLSFRYARDPGRSYKTDITGVKIAVWNTTNDGVRAIHEVTSDQVFNPALRAEDYQDNTKVIAIQRRVQNSDGSFRWDTEQVNEANAFVEGYATGVEPCDNDGRPCKQTQNRNQRTVPVTELAYQVVDDTFNPYAGSSVQKETFQAPAGEICNIWWAGKDVQQAPAATPTPTFTPTATATATSTPSPTAPHPAKLPDTGGGPR